MIDLDIRYQNYQYVPMTWKKDEEGINILWKLKCWYIEFIQLTDERATSFGKLKNARVGVTQCYNCVLWLIPLSGESCHGNIIKNQLNFIMIIFNSFAIDYSAICNWSLKISVVNLSI